MVSSARWMSYLIKSISATKTIISTIIMGEVMIISSMVRKNLD
jgi:hypothetical protein